MKPAQRCVAPTLLIVLLLTAAAPGLPASSAAARLAALRTPPGFHISLYADDLPGARSMAIGAGGVVFVGTRKEGRVYAVVDTDGDHRADRTHVLAEGMNAPNGVAYRNGSLYVAEVSRILRFDDIDAHLEAPPPPVVVREDFPTDYHHGWKYIAFGPDGLLYVPVGAPCNVCARNDRRYAAILRMRPDGSALEIFVEGWLQGRRAWGRPVDVVMTPDGDLLASDDRAGVIYRITYAP